MRKINRLAQRGVKLTTDADLQRLDGVFCNVRIIDKQLDFTIYDPLGPRVVRIFLHQFAREHRLQVLFMLIPLRMVDLRCHADRVLWG